MAPENNDDSGTRPDEPAEGRPEGLDVIAGTQDHSLDTVRETSDEVIARRRGMFGVSGTGDTSGYGGLTRAVEMPGSTQPPFGGWMDDVASALAEATRAAGLESAVEKIVVHRGEITFFVRREDLPATVKVFRDDEKLRFEFCSGRQRGALPRRHRP